MIETLQLPPVAEQKLPQGVFDSITSMMLNDSDWIEGPKGLVSYGFTDTNTTEAIDMVIPAEFGNELDPPTARRLASRAVAFAAGSKFNIRNILILPAPGRFAGHYSGEVGKDNPLGDLAQSYSDMLEPILGEKSAVIYGCSQGAAIAPHLAKQLPEGSCSHLVALEPPNVVNRGRIALLQAMGQHPDWKTQAMAGLPDNFRQNLIGPGSNTSFFLGALTVANYRLPGPNGMGSDRFAETISGLSDSIQTIVAWATDSAISPNETMEGLVLPNGLIRVAVSPASGETLGDPVANNLIVAHRLGEIARKASC